MAEREENFLWDEAREFTPAMLSLLFFSFVITLLFLVPSIYMHQIFERVMQSRSIPTLVALTLIVAFLSIAWTGLEHVRTRTLQQVANALDEKISVRVFDALNRQTDNLPAASRGVVMQDLNVIRDFVSGNLPLQFMDCFWVPLILIATALYHPILGLTVFAMTIVVAVLALLTQRVARDDVMRSLTASSQATDFGRAIMINAEASRVMGMMPALVARWRDRQEQVLGWQQGAIDRTTMFALALRYFRHMYMPLTLLVGTLLFLNEQVNAGVIFAATILVGRAIQPVDSIANNWRGFWNASLSAKRLDRMLREAAKRQRRFSLPAPAGPLVVSRVAATPRNRDMAVINDVSFAVDPGRIVGVVGASGAGKSSLARVLTGAWPVVRGSVTLDGHDISHWDQDELGRHIGYVPQDVELLPGTIGENIARFDRVGGETDARVVEAVRLANIQDIIARLPEGLNTRLGADGHTLSSGQRQRVALARAVYGDPRLLVLDEPNSNLDAIGEQHLANSMTAMRDRGAIIILVTHRMNMLTYCDDVLVMNSGTVHAFGPREHVVNRLSGYQPPKQITERPSAPGGTIAA